jgi:hypothetical protein
VCVCILALVIQHAKCIFSMQNVLSPVACLALPHFSHYLINGMIFRKKKVLNIKHVFRFSLELPSEIFPILRRIQRDIIINVHRSSCKVGLPIILVIFLIKLEFSRQIFEKSSNIECHENPSSGSRVIPCGRMHDG